MSTCCGHATSAGWFVVKQSGPRRRLSQASQGQATTPRRPLSVQSQPHLAPWPICVGPICPSLDDGIVHLRPELGPPMQSRPSLNQSLPRPASAHPRPALARPRPSRKSILAWPRPSTAHARASLQPWPSLALALAAQGGPEPKDRLQLYSKLNDY